MTDDNILYCLIQWVVSNARRDAVGDEVMLFGNADKICKNLYIQTE